MGKSKSNLGSTPLQWCELHNLILMDDDKGLEGWDNYECDSYEKAVEVIDGGFGIIELAG